jgi:hypothetical protein
MADKRAPTELATIAAHPCRATLRSTIALPGVTYSEAWSTLRRLLLVLRGHHLRRLQGEASGNRVLQGLEWDAREAKKSRGVSQSVPPWECRNRK